MARQTADMLRKARGFVERGWCQRESAMGDWGAVAPQAPEAKSWCAFGAILRAASEMATQDIGDAVFALRQQTSGMPLTAWNDSPTATRETVIAAFDRAIAAEEATP